MRMWNGGCVHPVHHRDHIYTVRRMCAKQNCVREQEREKKHTYVYF